ncbi:MAG: PIG-L family deacetylase, partial [Candidatus Hydrogenedentes bacterium]|nr:PIG-L family deacetylase [Candidatus Hydrogenedentota bacterium]
MKTMRIVLLSLILSGFSPLVALAEPSLGSVARHQGFLDLGTDLRLMCVAAHPDDEDGATLAMYRKKYGYKTFAVLATRGEGGQNEIGPELYEELAVLRTHETANASKITGAELHFLNLPDFGYSKSREETYALWGREVALERMVRKIRELRPDVIITHHAPQGAHGHHQAIGDTLQRAFDVSADAKVFPEHLEEGLEPWQAARLYVRSFRGGGDGARIDFNELEPVRGYSYAEIAAQALREHKTQGMGFFIDRFLTSRSHGSYGLVKESGGGVQGAGSVGAPGGALFEGLMDRISERTRRVSVKGLTDRLAREDLVELFGLLDTDGVSSAAANRVLVAINELRIAVRVNDDEVIPGQTVSLSVEAIDFGDVDAKNVSFSVQTSAWFPAVVAKPVEKSFSADGFSSAEFEFTVPEDQPRTVPHAEFVFAPHFLEAQITVVADVDIGEGHTVRLEAPILLDVMPAVSIEFAGAPHLIRSGVDASIAAKMLVTNHTPGAKDVTVRVAADTGISLGADNFDVTFAAEGDQKIVPVPVRVARGLESGDYRLTALIEGTDYSTESIVRVVDVKVPKNKKVGVIFSYDDTFVNTLERLGVAHTTLEIEDFRPKRLDDFTTIIVDIRAYLVRPDLVANNQALLDYVHRGGTVIVMYQKTFEWNSAYA